MRAHREFGDALLEEGLGNLSKPSVFSPVPPYFSVVIKARESPCQAPFIYLHNKYSLHLDFAQDMPLRHHKLVFAFFHFLPSFLEKGLTSNITTYRSRPVPPASDFWVWLFPVTEA